MTQKARGLFSLRNFRGLDKENKLLKVQSFRATDGYNFIIDSETLKTRPSFSIAHNPNFFLEEGDYLIDYDVFGDIFVYITRRHIYISSGNNVYNEKSSQIIASPFLSTLDFENLKPLFQEEKEVLFIFCLNEIYVVSTIKNQDSTVNKFVLYDLKEKPNNPFNSITEELLWKQFEDLPTPYVPTLFLGGQPLDDINLLSNKSRYRLFAEVPKTTVGSTTYLLPTYYNKEKHGLLEKKNVQVSFYKNRFDDYEVFPVFMGVQNEDWFEEIVTVEGVSTAGDYGVVQNLSEPIVIENTFFPIREFEYYKDGENEITPIYERLNLSKKDFFEMIVKSSNNETVFEYLMRQIKLNQSTITDNQVFVFSLQVQNESVFRNITTTNVIEKIVKQKIFPVYVQLKKFEDDTFNFSQENISFNSVTTSVLSDDYPPYVDITQPDDYYQLNDGNAILLSGEAIDVQTEFVKLAKNKIIEEENDISSGSPIMVEGRLFTTSFVPNPLARTIIFPKKVEENSLELSGDGEDVYPDQEASAYPTIDNPSPSLPVKDFGYIVESGNTQGIFTFATSTSERILLENLINQYLSTQQSITDGFSSNVQYGIFKAKIRRSNFLFEAMPPLDERIYRVVSVVVKVFITPPLTQTQTRYSMTYTATLNKTEVPIVDISEGINNLYEVNFKEDFAFIELKVKDYFFDYKNEPSIEVLVTLDSNLDYENISRSTFGATFGSENRLFLAGNKQFPNIDRFNVSNDLLGDNVKSQSYESTYFPSKNYRVIGGKGAINGYVIATDTQLYVTKENYPNDSKLFIRQRLIDDNGRVSYNEFKTNITKTPINNRCIVRFYNDILILAKDGLYGIEISSNVLTDERLVKLRSGFINKDLMKAIEQYGNEDVFILENNVYMYIFIGDKVYVADSRYISQNPNSAAENVSYEIIEWKTNTNYIGGKVIDDKIYLIEENNNIVYGFEDVNSDYLIEKAENYIETTIDTYSGWLIFTGSAFNYVFANPLNYVLKIKEAKQWHSTGGSNGDCSISGTTITVLNNARFADVKDGDTLYFASNDGGSTSYHAFVVQGFEASGRTSFTFDDENQVEETNYDVIFKDVSNQELYISKTYTSEGITRFIVSLYKPSVVQVITQPLDELGVGKVYVQDGDLQVAKKTPIELKWVSAITDFGNSQMEKTMFRTNLFATKKDEDNSVMFGYRTMRRLAGFSDSIDLSNNFDFEQVNYTQFNLATFDTVAVSLPMKENNFLYIQFTLNGYGKIEMNAIEIVYKMNRMLKSIG
jgi:hypothetical protein